MPSPVKETMIPSLPQLAATQLQPPPSPGTHRALRKLQSAHNLGAKAANQPSLISQQRFQQQQQQHRGVSPTRKGRNVSVNRSPQRARANSDANLLQPMGDLAPNGHPTLSRRSGASDGLGLERLFRDGPPDGDWESAVGSLRHHVLSNGIKSDSDGMSNLRIYVWLVMLDAQVLNTDDYLALIHRGASPAYSKIRNDTFRTLSTDPLFRRRVSEASLIRLLNAVAWKLFDARPLSSRPSLSQQETPTKGIDLHSQASSPAAKNRARALTLTTEGSESSMVSEPGLYVQGMNVLAGPFLYSARSEVEAFSGVHRLLTKECPGYIRGAMDGVHKGVALVDKVLSIVDPKLSLYLTSKGLTAKIYAFSSILTLSACTPPLPELLKLWDFLFAYGPHLNIVCVAAQLYLHRNTILASPSPNLRNFPPLNAEKIKNITVYMLTMIPDDIYQEIVSHAK